MDQEGWEQPEPEPEPDEVLITPAPREPLALPAPGDLPAIDDGEFVMVGDDDK